jgi:glycosyltransferase involved in cell wall biosynthesis
MSASKKIAMIVPGLEVSGGIATVANFLAEIVDQHPHYDLDLISLCMNSFEETSVMLSQPASWARGVSVRNAIWHNKEIRHVGAHFCELEFQRYKPRQARSQLLERCDLIQVISGSPAWANAVKGLGNPVVQHVDTLAKIERETRDKNPTSAKDWWRRAMTKITEKLDDKALRNVDAIQVYNSWMIDYAREINADREVLIEYAPPGIDDALFTPNPSKNTKAKPYILTVSRLDDPRKNIELLLDVYANLPKKWHGQVELVLAGQSEPTSSFWERAERYGIRKYVKYIARPSIEELVLLYQEANIFVLSSNEEGLGLVLLEAMACGTPVISTKCGGPDGIINDGVDGFLVPIGDSKLMAQKCVTLLEGAELNKKMGKAARTTIENRYSNKATSEAFIKTWDYLLRTHSVA